MAIEEVLTLISRIAFICCQGCLIAFWIMLWRQNRARKKREEEYRRDFEALQNLSGEEYWKAYAKFKQIIYEDSEGANLAVDRHGDLEDSAQEDGWYVNGDRHYCPNCYTINENDEVVTKPLIDYYFFKFKNVLQMLTGRQYTFSETETLFVLKSNYCYKRLNEAQSLILRDIIPDFVVDYRTPERVKGKRYETETIRIPKDFKHK